MNPETPPTPPTPPTPREKLELRLTALLMGELPPEEAAALRALMAADPGLAALHARLRRAFELLREASALAEPPAPPAPAQLSSERREKLLAHFKTATPTPAAPLAPAPIAEMPRRNWTWIVPTGIAAAVIAVLGAALLLPAFTSVRVRGGSARMSPGSSNGYAYEYLSLQAGTINTTSGLLPQSTPSPMNISTPGMGSGSGYAGGTFGLVSPLTTGATESGSGTLALPPAPPQSINIAGVGLLPEPPVKTTSIAIAQQLKGAKLEVDAGDRFNTVRVPRTDASSTPAPSLPPGDVFNTVRVDASKQRLMNLNYFAKEDAYPEEAAAPSVTTATTGGTLAIDKYRDSREDQKKPFPGDLNGQGDILISGANTYTGGITINTGALTLGQAKSGVPLPPDVAVAETGAGNLTLNGSNTFTGATAGSGVVTGGVTFNSNGSNGDAGALTGNIADAARTNPTDITFGDGMISTGASNTSATTTVTNTLNLASGGLIFGVKKDTPPAKRPLTFAGKGSLDSVTRSTTETAKPAAASPLPIDGYNSAIGALSSNTQERVAPGAQVKRDGADSSQLSKTTPLASVPSPSPAPGPGVPGTQSLAQKEREMKTVEAKLKAKDTSKETPQQFNGWVTVAGNIGTAWTPAPRATPVTGKTQAVAKLESAKKAQIVEEDIRKQYDATGRIMNSRIFGKPPADALPSDAVVAELEKKKDTTKETPRQQLTAPTTPQPEVLTRDNAFSTFSLNVSDVSFKLAAANLEQGRIPEPSSIRSEEFVNAFDYRDPEPAPGAPLAFASERARYPFAQNRDLLRFSVKTAAAGRQPGRPLNIVLLLDKSGSMERADRVAIVREALRVLAAQLQPQDKLSIVTFARTPRLWADGVAGNKAGDVIARVSEITPEGGTNLDAALDLGYATALRHYSVGSISRVVLFTDGAANLGDVDSAALTQKVETHRKKGVALDCFGIGWEGYNDDLLEQLTRNGDGRYGFINTPEEAASNFAAQLAGALQVAASHVKTHVEVNPRRVKAYRQIGYAKHQLTKEQFRDNTVNAAQIGAAESGNALYVVEVDPRGEGDLATVRVRFRVPGTNDYREHEWAVPFNGNAPPLEQSSPALRLAGTAAAFSEMLASSPSAAEVTSDHLLGLLNGVPTTYGADPRPKKLEWMIRQAKNLSGH